MKKRVVSVTLALTLACSMLLTNANASYRRKLTGATEATKQEIEYLNAQCKESVEKANRTEFEALSCTTASTKGTNWIYTSRNFYYYGQETGNSCGPACVRMALRNITGINYSEAVVRKGCNMSDTGTAIGNLKFYINSMQSYNSYVVRVGMDKETMKFNLYSGIVNWDAPPIIGVDENSKKGWNFNLGGHYVIAYAVSSDKKYFMISDPWAGYVGQAEKRDLKISVDDLYTGYIAVQIGYLF